MALAHGNVYGPISIHALREEGDRPQNTRFTAKCISIHALREEGDLRWAGPAVRVPKFLSTPSARRATRLLRAGQHLHQISIHALREEGDPPSVAGFRAMFLFLSTPSARRATTRVWAFGRLLLNFYPRPPRGGRRHPSPKRPGRNDFYPRPPRGGRPLPIRAYTMIWNISIHALREEGDSITAVL